MISRYYRIYKAFIKTNIALFTTYVANFYMNLFSGFLWASFTIATIVLLTSHSSTVFGWTRGELIVLTASFNIVRGIFTTFFSKNFYMLADTIFRGNLDGLLLKPVSSQFLTTTQRIDFPAVIRIIIGFVVIGYMDYIGEITITLINLLGYLVLIIFGLILFYSVWQIVITTLIWNPLLDNLKDFLIYITGISRYPPKLFQQGLGDVPYMILLPVLLIVAPGTRVLVGDVLSGDIALLLIMSVGLLYISHVFWQFALRYYTSASS